MLQLFEAVGSQPTAIKGIRYMLQVLEAVGSQPTAIRGICCSYLKL